MKKKAKYISRIEWFCITMIVTMLASIILPSLPPFSGHPPRLSFPNAKWLIGNISRMQQGYYLEHGHFATSMQQLEREFGELSSSYIKKNWEISIQIKDDIAFAYAVAKYINPNQNSYSYVAATTTKGKTDNDQYQWKTIICRTIEPSTAQPAAPILQESKKFIFWRHDAKLVCSSGTEDCTRANTRTCPEKPL